MVKDIILYHNEHFAFDCNCSFCINRRGIIQTLEELGYSVGILPFQCNWDKFYPSKLHFDYALLYQNKIFGQFMFEANQMPIGLVNFANTYFDYIICSSTFLQEAWINSGINKKFLIPSCLGIDTKLFNVGLPNQDWYPTKFKFLIVGNWQHRSEWNDRKGMLLAIDCFKTKFKDNPNVVLIIKTDINAPDEFGANNIIVIKENLFNVAMADLYKSCAKNGAFLSLHKGEGFGKPALEALCCGCNIGATNFSGVTTFLNSTNATLFNYKLVDWNIYPKEMYLENKLPQFALVDTGLVSHWMSTVINSPIQKNSIDSSIYSWTYCVKDLMQKINLKLYGN